MHPEGRFEAEVRETGVSRTRNAKLQVTVAFATEHGELVERFSLEGGALEISRRQLTACGWDGRSFGNLNREPSPCAGVRLEVQVVHEERYDGKGQVARVRIPGPAVLRDEDAAAEADRLLGVEPTTEHRAPHARGEVPF